MQRTTSMLPDDYIGVFVGDNTPVGTVNPIRPRSSGIKGDARLFGQRHLNLAIY